MPRKAGHLISRVETWRGSGREEKKEKKENPWSFPMRTFSDLNLHSVTTVGGGKKRGKKGLTDVSARVRPGKKEGEGREHRGCCYRLLDRKLN